MKFDTIVRHYLFFVATVRLLYLQTLAVSFFRFTLTDSIHYSFMKLNIRFHIIVTTIENQYALFSYKNISIYK